MKYIKLYENFNENDLKISSTNQNVGIYYKVGYFLAACEISKISDNEWYVNRVKVPKGNEGKGIGSFILKKSNK